MILSVFLGIIYIAVTWILAALFMVFVVREAMHDEYQVVVIIASPVLLPLSFLFC